jgi:hypothetical protein
MSNNELITKETTCIGLKACLQSETRRPPRDAITDRPSRQRAIDKSKERKTRMRHATIVFLAVCVMASFTTAVARAQSPHYVQGPTAALNGANAVVSWKEAGLGSIAPPAVVTYTASASGSATYACINKGGNHPAASNKENVNGPVSSTGAFPVSKSGTVTGSLSIEPPPSTLDCPGGQAEQLACVSYANIALTSSAQGTAVAATPSSLGPTCLLSGNLVSLCSSLCP